MEQLGPAWRLTLDNLVAWLILLLVAAVASALTCSLFFWIALPNVTILVKRAVERGGSPEIGDLLVLHGWLGRALQAVVLALVGGLSNVVPLLGPLLAGAALFYAPMLLAEGHHGVFGSMAASWHGAKDRLVPMVLLVAVTIVLWVLATALCFVPALVVGPWLLVAAWLDYAAHRDGILAAATAAGVPARG